MIRFDGVHETIIPDQEAGADVTLFSFLPGLSRIVSRPIPESPFTQDLSIGGHRPISDADRAYYQQRADQELELARSADDERVARSHSLLAGYYLDLVYLERLIDAG